MSVAHYQRLLKNPLQKADTYNPYHQLPLNSYTVFELRRPRNYSHPYAKIGCPSDFPQRLSHCSDDSSFKTARYDWSHVNPVIRVTV